MSAPVASALIAVGFIANLMFTTRVAHGDNATIDADGVAMLFPSASGASFRLGSEDPNQSRRFKIEKGSAVAHSEGPLHFWTTDAYDLDYASGGEGRTSRLHIYASGGKQQFTWQSQHGYLARPDDVRNQELTVYARVRGLSDAKRAAVALKIRGGAHSKSAPEKASCVMLTFQMASTGAVTRFGKELDHPLYDYVTLEPKLSVALGEGQWYGLKS